MNDSTDIEAVRDNYILQTRKRERERAKGEGRQRRREGEMWRKRQEERKIGGSEGEMKKPIWRNMEETDVDSRCIMGVVNNAIPKFHLI